MESILFYEANIRDLAERLHLGPQAEVLELIEEFNSRYILIQDEFVHYDTMKAPKGTKPLSINKKFGWKPGAYDTLKTIIYSIQKLEKRANSMTRVIERVRSESSWKMRNLDNDITRIEGLLKQMRSNNIVMQDNSDTAIEAYNIINNHFIEQYQNSNGLFDVRIEPLIENNQVMDYHIYVFYPYVKPNITYRHIEGNEIGTFQFQGEVTIRVKYRLSKLVNILINNNMDISRFNSAVVQNMHNNSKKGTFGIASKVKSDYNLRHPYITSRMVRDRSGNLLDYNYTCFGNIQPEVDACLASLDLISAKIFMDRLITHYDTNTNPLNRLPLAYYGIPKELEGNEQWNNIMPFMTDEDCNYYDILVNMPRDIVKTDSYCANYCSFVSECSIYKAKTRQLTVEEKERRALEQATLTAARRI
tara:strand:- start:244 stop:1497 length:1254 start_codon:yes stop_codon:yes gene_type:complete